MSVLFGVMCDGCGAIVASPRAHSDAARKAHAQGWTFEGGIVDAVMDAYCDDCTADRISHSIRNTEPELKETS